MKKLKTINGATIYMDDIHPIAIRFRGRVAALDSPAQSHRSLIKRLRGAPKRLISAAQFMAVLAAIQAA